MNIIKIELIKTRQCGLEVYLIKINGVIASSALSERGAYNQFYKLQFKYKKIDRLNEYDF